MERFHYENGEQRSKTQWTADILHNLESLLQEWDSTRTQQRRLQASPNLSLDFSKMFDPWGNIKALHWNLKSVDVAAMLRCSQVRSKMLSPQSLCLWRVLSLFNSWHFLDLLPLKGVDGQKAPNMSASFWCSPLLWWILLKFLLKCHLQGDHQVCWRNVHWDWQDLGIESWHMAFCPNFILHIFLIILSTRFVRYIHL